LGNTTLEPGAARRGLEIAPAGRGADTADRVVDRAPTGAAAEMRGQRSIQITRPRGAGPHDDARRAETALRPAARHERRREPVAGLDFESLDCGHRPPG